MAYSELIKDFSRVREYLREFYVYGFRTREEIGAKSARTYDDERRRVESWLYDYMRFRQDANGKRVFLSLDSRESGANPMFRAYRAKSFTDMDIVLHFCLMDMLCEEALTPREALDRLCEEYLADAEVFLPPDETTVRRKLKEYERIGLVTSRREGRVMRFSLAKDAVPRERWADAVGFFSETAPLGVIGSYIGSTEGVPFAFKHRFLLNAPDGEVMYALLGCMESGLAAELTVFSRRRGQENKRQVFPLRFYLSAQNGREYLLAWRYDEQKLWFFRLDGIRKVSPGKTDPQADTYREAEREASGHLWGPNLGSGELEHIEADIRAEANEPFIAARLEREKRCGSVTRIGDTLWRFEADVCDAGDLLPWLRTFIGRIARLSCSNAAVEARFRDDLREMAEMYGGGADAVQ